MPTKIIMPQLGESVVEGTISRWLKQEGESIDEMESLLEVSTDKVDTEIPSPAHGTVLKILVPEGETVRAGTLIAWIGQPGENLPDAPTGNPQRAAVKQAPEADQPGAERPAEVIQSTVDIPTQPVSAVRHGNGQTANQESEPGADIQKPTAGRSRELGFISPIVARLAQEHQVDLSQVPGTGDGGRITKKDVLAFVEQSPGKAGGSSGAFALGNAWRGGFVPPDRNGFRPAKGRGEDRAGASDPSRAGSAAREYP